ncbi:MAG: hypothetical protein M0R06_22610 [Sphaerochaeta sp.]|jgi:hypothetical protein|nr:hypothetical protein [Sphaerochaeta sp.]
MDIDAIARKWIEQEGDGILLQQPQGAVARLLRERAATVQAVLDAAAVPELEAQCAAMREALEEAIKAIRSWHGLGLGMDAVMEQQMWDIYRLNAPEMKPICDALNEAAGRAFLARLQAAEKVCEVAKRDHVFCTAECASCEVGSCAESDLRDALREWERKEATP